MVSAGIGGPDFRLGSEQLARLQHELDQAEAAGEDAVIFMHTYPANLREGAERLGTLLAKPHVACMDMGHTHHDELANDGRTIFMATRFTGQIEEGPPGFSIAGVDGHGVSWRFKRLCEWAPLQRHADGGDADRVGAWPEKDIFDTQLGPNRKGRTW